MKSKSGVRLLVLVAGQAAILFATADNVSDVRQMAPFSSNNDNSRSPIRDCFECCNEMVADVAARAARRKCFKECRLCHTCQGCPLCNETCVRSFDKLRHCLVPLIPNGTLKSVLGPRQYVDDGITLAFHCRGGFIAANNVNYVECNNGTWSSQPRCIPAPCIEGPPALRDGVVRFHSRRHGDRAKYECSAGYELSGDIFLTCRYGKWSGVQAICETVRCKSPDSIENGSISSSVPRVHRLNSSTFRHGDQIKYKCDDGFHRIRGPTEATCLNGVWSPPDRPECRQGRVFMRTISRHQTSDYRKIIVS